MLLGDGIRASAPPAPLRHPLLWTRGVLEARLYRLFPRHGALADALLLGRREGLDPALRQRFSDSGLSHLLAVSGAHVGLVAGALVLAGGALRLSRRRLSFATLALVWLYLALIGAPPSAVRAGIMISLALVGHLLQRPHASVAVIATAAWVILAASPLSALDIGFQLSFAGVLGIVAAHAVVLRRLPGWIRRRQPWKSLAELVVLSVGAFLLTAPIIAYHFQQVAPISIVANVPAIPLMGLAMNGLLLALITEPIVPPLGRLVADGAGGMLDLLDAVSRWAAEVPGGHAMIARPDGWMWAAAGVALLVALTWTRALRPAVRGTVGAATSLAVILAWSPLAGDGGALEIHVLDVGQGDALALRTPAGRWVLVDAGPRSERFDAGERRVLPFLRAHGVRRLEALFLTHPDADHIGGAPAVLKGIEVRRLIDPGMPVGKPLYLEVLQTAEARGVTWSAGESGQTMELDGVKIDVLWPDTGLVAQARDANDVSLVLRVRYGQMAIILPGDAPASVEELLVGRHGPALRAAILKLGHHGSKTSTAGAWLDVVRPELAVISVGAHNRYGHPAAPVLGRLVERGIPLARTDRDGTLVYRFVLAPLPRWSQTE
jgi:competence protein ComEC